MWNCTHTAHNACFYAERIKAVKRFLHFVHTTAAIKLTEHTARLLTPCSSSFISWSVTLGVLSARRRQCTLSSGTRYSSTSLSGRPRARPCLDVEGTASSRMEPLRVLSCTQHNQMEKKKKTEKKKITATVFVQIRQSHWWNTLVCCKSVETVGDSFFFFNYIYCMYYRCVCVCVYFIRKKLCYVLRGT